MDRAGIAYQGENLFRLAQTSAYFSLADRHTKKTPVCLQLPIRNWSTFYSKKLRGGNSLLLLIVPHEHQGSVLDWVNVHHLNFLPICWPCTWVLGSSGSLTMSLTWAKLLRKPSTRQGTAPEKESNLQVLQTLKYCRDKLHGLTSS